MKTKLTLFISLCFPAVAQFVFPTGLATWKASTPDITTGLVAYYPLNESSGNALDASGNSRTMTQGGTVGAGSGATANSRGAYSSLDYFGRTDSAFQLNAADWTITGWFYLNSATATSMLIAQNTFNVPDNKKAWAIYAYVDGGADSRVYVGVSDTSGVDAYGVAPGSSVSTSAWHFVVGKFDASTKTVSCSVDASAFGSAVLSGTPNTASGNPTRIGNQEYVGYLNPMDGYAGKIRIYSGRVLNTAEISYLYNGGTFSTAP